MTLRVAIFIVALPLLVCGCATKSTMTAKAVGCNVINLDIVQNEASRRGSATDWCARCKGALYRCVGNAARDKVECRPAKEEDRCG